MAYSPDGQYAYFRDASAIYRIDLQTGKNVVIQDGIRSLPMAEVGFSPDGKTLYFDDEVGDSNIWITRPQK